MRLSICIPTYNRAEFLPETLEAIIPQLRDGVEIVICDNFSTDDSMDVLKRLQDRDDRIKVFQNPENLGADRNYLATVSHAIGEYCWLFGSDDIMRPGAVDTILEALDATKADVILGSATLCDFNMNPIREHDFIELDNKFEYNLSNEDERIDYFSRSQDTAALFSYLSVIIVRRDRWNQSKTRENFIGSLWIHVVKILDMMEKGLVVKLLPVSLLKKRGDNDSFLDKGVLRRMSVSVDDFNNVIETFFDSKSAEAFHVRRCIRNEVRLIAFLSLKEVLVRKGSKEDLRDLNRMLLRHYQDPGLSNWCKKALVAMLPVQVLSIVKYVKKRLKR